MRSQGYACTVVGHQSESSAVPVEDLDPYRISSVSEGVGDQIADDLSDPGRVPYGADRVTAELYVGELLLAEFFEDLSSLGGQVDRDSIDGEFGLARDCDHPRAQQISGQSAKAAASYPTAAPRDSRLPTSLLASFRSWSRSNGLPTNPSACAWSALYLVSAVS